MLLDGLRSMTGSELVMSNSISAKATVMFSPSDTRTLRRRSDTFSSCPEIANSADPRISLYTETGAEPLTCTSLLPLPVMLTNKLSVCAVVRSTLLCSALDTTEMSMLTRLALSTSWRR